MDQPTVHCSSRSTAILLERPRLQGAAEVQACNICRFEYLDGRQSPRSKDLRTSITVFAQLQILAKQETGIEDLPPLNIVELLSGHIIITIMKARAPFYHA